MRPSISPHHVYRWARDEAEVDAARQLVGVRYREAGYVDQSELDAKNRLRDDRYLAYARYAVAVHQLTNQVDGAIRQISANPHGFPAVTDFVLRPGWQEVAPGFTDAGAVEISNLAVRRHAASEIFSIGPALYRFIWQEGMRDRTVRYWLAAIHETLFNAFVSTFHFNFKPIGEKAFYRGSMTIPALLDIQAVYAYMLARDPELVAYFEEGLEPEFRPVVKPLPVNSESV